MKKISKFLALSVASLVGFGCFASANAAVIVTFDLRQAGTDAKNIELTQPNQAITFNIYAQITNNDGVRTNDGIASASLRFVSIEDASGLLQGNFSGATRAASFSGLGSNGLATASPGYDTNLDLEWGGTGATNTTGNFNPITTVSVFGTGSGAGPTEILLGTINWTGPAVVPVVPTFTDLNIVYYKNTSNSNGAFNVTSDGAAAVNNGNADANQAVGAAVHIFTPVPEPASLGVLALGGLALLGRRRK